VTEACSGSRASPIRPSFTLSRRWCGKTHLLVGFGLLAKHPGLRKKYCADLSYGEEFAVAKVAAFNGRNSPTITFGVRSPSSLGRRAVHGILTNGPKAPDERDWLQLFEKGPILILLDEMPPYFHYLATQKVGRGRWRTLPPAHSPTCYRRLARRPMLPLLSRTSRGV